MSLTKAHNRMIQGSPTNVLDFGASGDGVTDDTAAIQAAATSLTSGGTLILPTGSYLVSSAITLPDNVNIIGELAGSIITCASMSGGAFASIVAGANSIIEKLKFSGVDEDVTGASAIRINGKDGVIINDCIITGFGDPIYITDADDFVVKNNKITDFHRWGIQFAKATNGVISNNIVKNSTLYDGIKGNGNIYGDASFYESSNIIISENVCTGHNRDGIDMASDFANITISNNTCTGNTLNGIEIKLITGGSTATRANIVSNIVNSNGSTGIRIDDITSSKISGNIIDNSGADGILATYCKDCDIVDNIVRTSIDNGIRILGESGNLAEYINILGNKCINNGNNSDNGIQVDIFSYYITVKENYCYQNTSSKTNIGIKINGAAANSAYITIEDNYCPNTLTVSGTGISIGTHSGDNIILGSNNVSISGIVSFADGDTSPSIAGCNSTYQTANTGATTITTFDNGAYEMKPFTIVFADANTTLANSASLRLKGGINKTFTQYSTITLLRRNNVFYEIARQET